MDPITEVKSPKIKNQARAEAARKGWVKRKAAKAAKLSEAFGADAPMIKEFFPDKAMAQIYDKGLEYAFVGPDGKQCHPFAYCKDFLQDAIWATLNKKPVAIYGFSYDPKSNPPLDMENTRMSIRLKGNKEFKQMCLKSLTFLNALEPTFGLAPSSLSYGGESKGSDVWVFVGDKKWMFSPPMISMYTLLIRVGLTYEGGNWEDHLNATNFIGRNDHSYLTAARPAIKFLGGKKLEEFFAPSLDKNYPPDCDVHSMHGSSGIQCLGNNYISASVNKNWVVKSIKK